MNILDTINELGKKAKNASIKIRVLKKEKKMAAYQCLETNIDKYDDIADILIIGTSFKLDNNVENPVDFERTKKIIEQIN